MAKRGFRGAKDRVGSLHPLLGSSLMVPLRSALFNVVFYANLILQMIVLTPVYFLMPRKASWIVPKPGPRPIMP